MRDKIPIASSWDCLQLVFGRRSGITIEGDSMLPTLKTGDRVLIDKNSAINVGDIIVANHPFKSSVKIVKRLAAIESDGRLFLSGDNPNESSDSRAFGSVIRSNVIGKVVYRMT